MHNYKNKFEYKPGKWIYEPTNRCRIEGQRIVQRVSASWTPNELFYHLGKSGGHLAALRPHLANHYKASVDLRKFFENVTRSKVVRALGKVGFSNSIAFAIAEVSCVVGNAKTHLPYGFVQSPFLATLVVEKSLLGQTLIGLRAEGIYVTMYVDDIILSHSNLAVLQSAYDAVRDAAGKSNLEISIPKCHDPGISIESFNIVCSGGGLRVTEPRMLQFLNDYRLASAKGKAAILRYLNVVNPTQAASVAAS